MDSTSCFPFVLDIGRFGVVRQSLNALGSGPLHVGPWSVLLSC